MSTGPIVIDGLTINRAEWEAMNGAEKVWAIATRAVERGLPADFMPATGPDRTTAWVGEHIGFSEYDTKVVEVTEAGGKVVEKVVDKYGMVKGRVRQIQMADPSE